MAKKNNANNTNTLPEQEFNFIVSDVRILILCQEKVQIKNDFFPSCQHT